MKPNADATEKRSSAEASASAAPIATTRFLQPSADIDTGTTSRSAGADPVTTRPPRPRAPARRAVTPGLIDPEGTRAVWHDICDRRAGSSVGVDACVRQRQWIGPAESTLAASQNKYRSLLNERRSLIGRGLQAAPRCDPSLRHRRALRRISGDARGSNRAREPTHAPAHRPRPRPNPDTGSVHKTGIAQQCVGSEGGR